MSKKTMRVYHDWEFEERHGFIDVISAGFVREDGQELYIVFNDFDTLSVARNEWLMANVMPSIGHVEITSHVTGTGQPVKDILIQYGAYDHVALCSIFGRMVDLPADWPMMTMDLKQMHKAAGRPQMPKQPQGLHNALEDARFNATRYKYLEKVLRGTTVIISEVQTAARLAAEKRGLEQDEYIVVSRPDQLRGLTFSKSRDRVVWLVPETEEMKFALDLSFRKA